MYHYAAARGEAALCYECYVFSWSLDPYCIAEQNMLSETFPIKKPDGFVRIRDLYIVLKRILRKMGNHTVDCQGAWCDGVLVASIFQVVEA